MVEVKRDEHGSYELRARDDEELIVLKRSLKAAREMPLKTHISDQAHDVLERIIGHQPHEVSIPLGDNPEHLRLLSLLTIVSSQHPDGPTADEVWPIAAVLSTEYDVSTFTAKIPDDL